MNHETQQNNVESYEEKEDSSSNPNKWVVCSILQGQELTEIESKQGNPNPNSCPYHIVYYMHIFQKYIYYL